MVRTKADPRREVGAIVHVKCTNVLPTHAECSRIFGRSFKAIFCNGKVKEVELQTNNAGRNSTHLVVLFEIAGVMKITKTLLLSKVYPGAAPGPRPPSPDVEIVTPARVTHVNRDDHSGGLQTNLHRTLTNAAPNHCNIPDGFLPMQQERMGSFGKKKQRTSKPTKRKASIPAHLSQRNDSEPTMPSFSDVCFTQVPGYEMDDDSMVDKDGKMPPVSEAQLAQMRVAERERQLDDKMALLEKQQRKMMLMIQGYSQGLSNTLAASTPAVLLTKTDKSTKSLPLPKTPPKSPPTGSDDPIAVASPVPSPTNQAPVVAVATTRTATNNNMQQGQDPDTDNAVVHTQSTINTDSSDSKYDADVVAELCSNKGER